MTEIEDKISNIHDFLNRQKIFEKFDQFYVDDTTVLKEAAISRLTEVINRDLFLDNLVYIQDANEDECVIVGFPFKNFDLNYKVSKTTQLNLSDDELKDHLKVFLYDLADMHKSYVEDMIERCKTLTEYLEHDLWSDSE